ncbi:STAS domain-containing protein [Streptomyces chiangmaiensis]|uniref:STAS domain-containing protein n=1 Tax=Streptomyces chiangmaiensis TaxID=766497 RepID=A0ABU7FPG2_9ACTN|nr:STAS domain-containing protein [Streptomyces chiangmaiensis]MED7825996.1 STAS domain-containing protein [Streptomyces chiangmaiensis]
MTTSTLDRPALGPTISWLCPCGVRITLLMGPGCSMLVRLSGELDIATSPAVNNALDFCLSLDHSHGVTLDAAEVTFIDAAGLRPLVEAHALSRRRGQWLRIAPASDALRRVLTLTRHTHRLLDCMAAGQGDTDQVRPGSPPQR